MDGDERDIFSFLKTCGADFVAPAEIARRAGSKKRFYDDPDWAKPVLARMLERAIVENNVMGHYRIKPLGKKGKNNKWVAPDIAKILQEGGVEVESAGEIGSDDYYDQL